MIVRDALHGRPSPVLDEKAIAARRLYHYGMYRLAYIFAMLCYAYVFCLPADRPAASV